MNPDRPFPGVTPSDASPTPHGAPPQAVRHRTERDASGRVWRFVYDPAAQDPRATDGTVRLRCTTGSARTMLVVLADWYDWPRVQLLDALATALKVGRSAEAGRVAGTARAAAPLDDRTLARRRLVRNVRGHAWNCVFDPSIAHDPAHEGFVRVRCTAGRDRLDLFLTPGWHRLGDRQLADLIEQALADRAG